MRASLSARATARELGISHVTLLARYRAGKFKAEIDDGRLLRFDPEKVRKGLSGKKPRRAVKFPPGMVPTY